MGVFGANFPVMVRGLVAMFWHGVDLIKGFLNFATVVINFGDLARFVKTKKK
jgi:cytosine/uracil/thiamine/allantoin permease